MNETRTSTPAANYWETVSRRPWLLLAVFAAVASLVFLAGLRERPLYRSAATLFVNQDGLGADPSHLFSQPAGVLNRRPNLANHIELLKSYSLARLVCASLPADQAVPLARRTGSDPAAGLQRWVSARPVRDADMIRLSVAAPDPALACSLTAAYVAAYRSLCLERSRADISAVKEFVSSQLEVVGSRLDTAEAALEAYKRAIRVADLSEETRALVDRQTRVLALYEQARAEREGCEHELAWLTGLLDSSGRALGVSLDNAARPVVAGLSSELYRLEAERANLLVQGFADTSRRVLAMGGRIAALRQRLNAEAGAVLTPAGAVSGTERFREVAGRAAALQCDLARLRATEATLERTLSSYDAALSSLPVRERTLARMTRNVEADRQVHALLAQRYEETRIQEAGRLSTVAMVDPPRPGQRVKPNHRNNALLALLLGLAFGLAAVFAVDWLDTRVRCPEDLERHGFAVIASIPRAAEQPAEAEPPAVGPLAGTHPESPFAEALRVLRTNIQFAAGDRPQRTIVVTSAGAGEGKSTVASNLAAVLAQSGRRTLLIDGDLRRPRQHRIHGFHKKPGLTDTVMLGVPLEQALHPGGQSVPDVIAGGTTPPSPVDFLNSAAFAGFLERVAGLYDAVVIDSPPVLVSADAAVLAAHVDGVVLVARMGDTDHRALTEAGRVLGQAGARVLGVVANELEAPRRYGYYRYKYRYYHYRYRQPSQPDAVTS